MSSPQVERGQRVRTRIPTIGGRALWISADLDQAGQAEQVTISEGYLDGPVDHRRVVQLPGSVITDLVDVLGRIQEVGE